MDYEFSRKAIAVFERIIAVLLSFIICGVTILMGLRIDRLKNYKDLFSNTISFASILTGVLMTLAGLLLGYASKVVVKRIKERNANNILVSYFCKPLIAGFTIVIMSLILSNLFDEKLIKSWLMLEVITSLWGFFVTYFICSTIRIFLLMLYILKEVFNEDIKTDDDKKVISSENNQLHFDKDCFNK